MYLTSRAHPSGSYMACFCRKPPYFILESHERPLFGKKYSELESHERPLFGKKSSELEKHAPVGLKPATCRREAPRANQHGTAIPMLTSRRDIIHTRIHTLGRRLGLARLLRAELLIFLILILIHIVSAITY